MRSLYLIVVLLFANLGLSGQSTLTVNQCGYIAHTKTTLCDEPFSFDPVGIATEYLCDIDNQCFVVHILDAPMANGLHGTTHYNAQTRTAIITINSIYTDDFRTLTLFHELVHVRQFLTGVLTFDINSYPNVFTFYGITYSVTQPYESRPWETFAYLEAERLFTEYMNGKEK